MYTFVQQSSAKFRDNNQERLKNVKNRINNLINELYNTVLTSAYTYENHRVPFHGITHPKLENPVNLFQRQLQIEQYSFETSHARYKKQVVDLMKLGRADQLSASHRNILRWTKTLESAISE